MRGFNRVLLIGNIAKDADTKYTQGGAAWSRFSVAVERRYQSVNGGNNYQTKVAWLSCVKWNSERLAEYLTKGRRVHIEGYLETYSYEQEGRTVYCTDVIAESILLLDGGRDGGDTNRTEGESVNNAGPVSQPSAEEQPHSSGKPGPSGESGGGSGTSSAGKKRAVRRR